MKSFGFYWSVLLILVFNVFLSAQSGWVAQVNPIGFGEEAMLGKVQFVSNVEGWISCGNGKLLHTTDTGQNWDIIIPFPNDTIGRFSDPSISMSWVGNSHGWIIGTIGGLSNPKGAVIYYTTQNGQQWQKKVLSTEPGTMGIQVQFVDQNNGYALLYNFSTGVASAFKSTDGGNNWSFFNNMGIFYFVDNNNGWAYSGSGINGSEPPFKIFRTTNGGTDWTEQFSDNTAGEFSSIFFSDLNNGWVVGAKGKVIKTTNGGSNWTFVTNMGLLPTETCKTVFFLDANNGWIPSKDNTNTPFIKHTTDGGVSWSTQPTPFSDPNGYNAIFSIYFVDANNGWLTADYGRIARYTGTTDADNNINPVNQFKLQQNYPNPFNPATSIQYSIGNREFVSLKIYDVLGTEITELVNEDKAAGNYEVKFNASNYPSGIYFYKLQAGSLTETKKMILLK